MFSHDLSLHRRVLHLALFLLGTVISPVWAQELPEEPLAGAGRRGEITTIPKEYGQLISVVESNGVHYLYFQDQEGNIRVFLIGVKGIASRARVDLEAIPHSVYKIQRSTDVKQDDQDYPRQNF